VIISQDRMLVEIYRRDNPARAQRLQQADDVLRLDSIGFSMTLAELYE
jgi:Uma2 family endonuclease